MSVCLSIYARASQVNTSDATYNRLPSISTFTQHYCLIEPLGFVIDGVKQNKKYAKMIFPGPVNLGFFVKIVYTKQACS